MGLTGRTTVPGACPSAPWHKLLEHRLLEGTAIVVHGGKLPADHRAECGLVVVPGALGLLQQKFQRCRLGPEAWRLTLTYIRLPHLHTHHLH